MSITETWILDWNCLSGMVRSIFIINPGTFFTFVSGFFFIKFLSFSNVHPFVYRTNSFVNLIVFPAWVGPTKTLFEISMGPPCLAYQSDIGRETSV